MQRNVFGHTGQVTASKAYRVAGISSALKAVLSPLNTLKSTKRWMPFTLLPSLCCQKTQSFFTFGILRSL